MDIKQSLNVPSHIAKRVIYRHMIDIKIDPEESMKVMAFWMWLEAQGFKEVVSKIFVYDDKFLDVIEERGVKVSASDEDGDRVGEDSRKETVVGGEGLLGSHPEGFEKMKQKGEGSSMIVQTNLNPFAKEWNPASERAPEEERCLFLTFSNGYPLTENQLINSFNQ
ncbi:hypothetical protein FCV25MIE_18561 [Fagus crenata]